MTLDWLSLAGNRNRLSCASSGILRSIDWRFPKSARQKKIVGKTNLRDGNCTLIILSVDYNQRIDRMPNEVA